MKKILPLVLVMLIVLFTTSIVFAAETQLQEKARDIVSALIWFGYAIALGMVVFIGIKYVMGAAEAKANMKSAIVGYLIGAAFVFSATTIANIVVNMVPKTGTDVGGLAESIVDAAESAANSIK